jgi:hypothetical protein
VSWEIRERRAQRAASWNWSAAMGEVKHGQHASTKELARTGSCLFPGAVHRENRRPPGRASRRARRAESQPWKAEGATRNYGEEQEMRRRADWANSVEEHGARRNSRKMGDRGSKNSQPCHHRRALRTDRGGAAMARTPRAGGRTQSELGRVPWARTRTGDRPAP